MEIPVLQAKDQVVKKISKGWSIAKAIESVGRTRSSYDQWRSLDAQFRKKVDEARAFAAGKSPEKENPQISDFASFRREYLGMETFEHQQQWIDLIEGKTLENLHPAIKYEPGDDRHILINCPPEHSKTITISVDYVTYRICKDPNVRIILVSATQTLSKQFVYAVKQRLTHPRYKKLQDAYAPPDGYKGGSSVWQSAQVYLDDSSRDSTEKDPTLTAIGVGSQIYGTRADLIVLDDCIVIHNAAQYEKQLQWIQQEVLTRLGPGGKLLICGTRVETVDLYREIRNPDRYPDGTSPWTYLAQPAVLEFADKPEDWLTLWPKSNVPWIGIPDRLKDGSLNPEAQPDENGLYDRWTGKRLYQRRGIIDPKTWSMVYMNQEVSDSAIFDPKDLRACVNGNRTVGVMRKGNEYHRDAGMDGLYIICSMDPAMTGDTATVVLAVDMQTRKRYVLDANRMTGPTPQQMRNLIRTWTEKYSPNLWVIEKNAFQLFLTRDEEIRAYLANRGVSMVEHYTGSNKIDPDFGVASVAPLFSERMIELPSSHNSEGVKALIEQLITWQPGKKGKDLKMDLPMALWFAELRARLMVDQHTMKSNQHRNNRWTPRARQRMKQVVYLDDYLTDGMIA